MWAIVDSTASRFVAGRAREDDVGRTVPGEVVQVERTAGRLVAANLQPYPGDGRALRIRNAPGEGVAVARQKAPLQGSAQSRVGHPGLDIPVHRD